MTIHFSRMTITRHKTGWWRVTLTYTLTNPFSIGNLHSNSEDLEDAVAGAWVRFTNMERWMKQNAELNAGYEQEEIPF